MLAQLQTHPMRELSRRPPPAAFPRQPLPSPPPRPSRHRSATPWVTRRSRSATFPAPSGAKPWPGIVDWSQYGSASRKSCLPPSAAGAGAFIAASYAASSVLLSSVVEDWALEFHGSSSDMRVQPTRLCATRLTPAGAERLSEEATKVDSMAQEASQATRSSRKK